MPRVFLFYAFSGLLSLGYQVVWFRIYVDRFGATNLTFALVLCNFILGLGCGGLASRAVTGWLARALRLRDRLRVYGVVELLVGASALLTIATQLIPSGAWGSFPYHLDGRGFYVPNAGYHGSELVLATVCVFVPCFFMGVTFPLLCQVFAAAQRFPSALYAWNTLGACSGVLVLQFALLPHLGHDRSLWLIAVANIVLGAFFVGTGGAPRQATAAEAQPLIAAGAAPASSSVRPAYWLTLAVLSGLLAGALEGDMFKRVAFLGGNSSAAMSFVSFWAILAIFLASWFVRAAPGLRLKHIKVAAALAVACYAMAWQLAYPVRGWFIERDVQSALQAMPELSLADREANVRFPTGSLQLLAYVGMFVFPAFLGMSLLFPYACNRLQSAGRHLGLAFGANTLAFCIGVVGFTLLAPRVNVFYSLKLSMVLLVVGVGLLVALVERQRRWVWKPVVAAACFAVGAGLIDRGFDPAYVIPKSPSRVYPVRALKSNGARTTYVVADPRGDILYFDNHPMSAAAAGGEVYMRLMAHFPLLAQPRPERALLICFGVGNTAAAIAAHDTIQRLDIVDLNDRVFETAPEFAARNGRVDQDSRVRLIHDDGRNFLNVTDQSYDLITSEPPPPMHPGIYRLYSQEYYEQVLAHLTPDGLMAQWLPIYQMPAEAVRLAVTTFLRVFPHALLFTGQSQNYILVGGARAIDVTRIERRFAEQPRVVDDLRRMVASVTTPTALLARIVQGDASLRRGYAAGPVISDQHNQLANLYQSPTEPAGFAYAPQAMLAEIGAERLQGFARLRDAVTHLGRLQYYVKYFPVDSLVSVRGAAARGVTLADVDWRQLRWLRRNCDEAARAGQPAESLRYAKQALAITPELPDQLLRVGAIHLQAGRYRRAEAVLRKLVGLLPEEAVGYSVLATVCIQTGREDQAEQHLRRALTLAPNYAASHYQLGSVLWNRQERERALHHHQRAVDLEPRLVAYRRALALALAGVGRYDEALRQLRAARRIEPGSPIVREAIAEVRRQRRAAARDR
ncbi:MAG: tetratricopeptide repeat protein [Planctomycetota bacterium]